MKNEMKTKDKIIQFEKYLKKKLAGLTIKQKIMFRFYEIFVEELKGTESGDKFRKKWME